MLALGKICEHTDDLPGPVSEKATIVHSTMSSPASGSDGRKGSTNQRGSSGGSEMAASASTPTQTPAPNATKRDRNIDVIPGLAYYAKAVEILGGLQGNDLPHVQAN